MGLPDVRSGNPGTSSTLGNVRPVAGQSGRPVSRSARSLPGMPTLARQQHHWDRLDYTDLQPRIERFNAFARGTYQVDDSTQAYAELSWFRVATDTRNQPSPTRAAWYDPATQSARCVAQHLPAGRPPRQPVLRQQPGGASLLRRRRERRHRRDYRTDSPAAASTASRHAQWDWDVAALYIRSDTDITQKNTYAYDRLLQGLVARAPMATTGSGRPRFTTILRSTTGSRRTVPGTRCPRTRSSTPRPRATSTSWTAANSRWRSGPARRNFQSRHAGHRDRQRRRRRLFARHGRSQHQRSVRGALRSDSRQPGSHCRASLQPLLRRRQHVQSQDRREVDGPPFARRARHGRPRSGRPASTRPVLRPPDLRAATIPYAACDPPAPDCQNPRQLYIVTPNPGQPETSTSYTLGLIWEPVPGLSGTLDYWRFVTDNTITTVEGEAVRNTEDDLPGRSPTPGRSSTCHTLRKRDETQTDRNPTSTCQPLRESRVLGGRFSCCGPARRRRLPS